MAADHTWLGTEEVLMLSLRMWGTQQLPLTQKMLLQMTGLAVALGQTPALASLSWAKGISGSCQRWLAAAAKSLVLQPTFCRLVHPPGLGPSANKESQPYTGEAGVVSGETDESSGQQSCLGSTSSRLSSWLYQRLSGCLWCHCP